jgi:hypothetical protein
VSFVAIGADGRLHRAEVQDGGVKALLAGLPFPEHLANAALAGLMSSGPNRPAPLSQFTPADADFGLVTGHRFPNSFGAHGRPLNLDVLDLMRDGLSPESALARVVAENPLADAGFIALSRRGELHSENTQAVDDLGDAGRGSGRSEDFLAGVDVLHNAIRPSKSLAGLVVEVALTAMAPPLLPDIEVSFRAGVPIRIGEANAFLVNNGSQVEAVVTRDKRHALGTWSFGLGYRTGVYQRGRLVGSALYEPFLIAENGRIASVDGQSSMRLPIQFRR